MYLNIIEVADSAESIISLLCRPCQYGRTPCATIDSLLSTAQAQGCACERRHSAYPSHTCTIGCPSHKNPLQPPQCARMEGQCETGLRAARRTDQDSLASHAETASLTSHRTSHSLLGVSETTKVHEVVGGVQSLTGAPLRLELLLRHEDRLLPANVGGISSVESTRVGAIGTPSNVRWESIACAWVHTWCTLGNNVGMMVHALTSVATLTVQQEKLARACLWAQWQTNPVELDHELWGVVKHARWSKPVQSRHFETQYEMLQCIRECLSNCIQQGVSNPTS